MTFYVERFTAALGDLSRSAYGTLLKDENVIGGWSYSFSVKSPVSKALDQLYYSAQRLLSLREGIESNSESRITSRLLHRLVDGKMLSLVNSLDEIRRMLLEAKWQPDLEEFRQLKPVEHLDRAADPLIVLLSRVRSDSIPLQAEKLLANVAIGCDRSILKELNALSSARHRCSRLWFDPATAALVKSFLDEIRLVRSGFYSELSMLSEQQKVDLFVRLRKIQYDLEAEELWDKTTAVPIILPSTA